MSGERRLEDAFRRREHHNFGRDASRQAGEIWGEYLTEIPYPIVGVAVPERKLRMASPPPQPLTVRIWKAVTSGP
jgi:hypothetical protein